MDPKKPVQVIHSTRRVVLEHLGTHNVAQTITTYQFTITVNSDHPRWAFGQLVDVDL